MKITKREKLDFFSTNRGREWGRNELKKLKKRVSKFKGGSNSRLTNAKPGRRGAKAGNSKSKKIKKSIGAKMKLERGGSRKEIISFLS